MNRPASRPGSWSRSWAGVALAFTLLWFAAALVACIRGVFDVPLPRACAITAASLLAHEVAHQVLRIVGVLA